MELLRGLAILFGAAFAVGTLAALRFRKRQGWLSGAAIVVLGSWPLWIMLSQATTCTMGDDDSWAVTLALCSILAGGAAPLLAASGATWRNHRAMVPLLTLAPLLFYVSHMLETGLGEHSLCGSVYTLYPSSRVLSQLFYPVMWGYGLLLSALAFLPLLRQRPTSAPPAP